MISPALPVSVTSITDMGDMSDDGPTAELVHMDHNAPE